MGDVQPVGAGQEPVQAGDFHAGAFGGRADLGATRRGDVFDAVGEGKGGDFDGGVSEVGRVVEDLFDGPVGEVLVAGGEFHVECSLWGWA